MNEVKIFRSQMARSSSGIFFTIDVLIFLPALLSRATPSRVVGGVLEVLSVWFLIRALRSGYLAVSDDQIVVRTLFRKRKFVRSTIKSVEPHEVNRYSRRVVPRITFHDARTYEMGEFFSQKSSYQRNPDENIVDRVVAAIKT